MGSEVAGRADFSAIRYAQCWEDADILIEALNIRPGAVCLSIASAGDNTLAMLARQPERVIALDLNSSQLFCLELRVAAYRALEHEQVLELLGSRPSRCRADLYRRCRNLLSPGAREFWDRHPDAVESGVGSAGKFEQYFALFRHWVLPLVHSKARVEELLRGGDRSKRTVFYETQWNTWRWKAMFRVFFSRWVMGRLGRDPSFFHYVEGSVSDRILERARYALCELDPADNPYLHWILKGCHGDSLPFALRVENFAAIRENLDRLEWHLCPIEDFLKEIGPNALDACNLSDIFEYMSDEMCRQLLEALVHSGRDGGRLAYWNMLVPRSRPDSLAASLRPLLPLAEQLFRRDKAFFYSRFVVEEIHR